MYDAEWNALDLKYLYNLAPKIDKLKKIDDVIVIAENFASNFDFVRVDLYNIKIEVEDLIQKI